MENLVYEPINKEDAEKIAADMRKLPFRSWQERIRTVDVIEATIGYRIKVRFTENATIEDFMYFKGFIHGAACALTRVIPTALQLEL